MNNEKYNQIIDEVYKNYAWKTSMDVDGQFTKKEFINKCKTDTEFSEKWGLKIEERELTLEERAKLLSIKVGWEIKETSLHGEGMFEAEVTQDSKWFNIPTRLITVTYNNETIEVYE